MLFSFATCGGSTGRSFAWLFRSEISIKSEDTIFCGLFYVGLLVLTDTLLEEVCLTSQGDHVHPLERVLNVVILGHSQSEKESVSDELNVLAHQARVHANELNR